MLDSLSEISKRRTRLRQWRWYTAFVMLLVILVILTIRLIFGSNPKSNANAVYHYVGYWIAAVAFAILTVIHFFQRHLPRQRLSEVVFFAFGYLIVIYFYWADLYFGDSLYARGYEQQNSAVGTVVWLGLLYIAPFIVWSLRVAIIVAIATYFSIIALWLYFAYILNYTMLAIRQGDLIHLAITGFITIILSMLLKQMTLLSAQERTMIEYALKDSLTNLPNRLYVDEFLRAEFRTASRSLSRTNPNLELSRHDKRPIAIAFCDIDHFKRVNDQFLHAIGDKTLQVFAQLLHHNVAHYNLADAHVVGRYGGEEFVLVFTNTSQEQAAAICEDLRQKIVNHNWSKIHPKLKITASFGVSDTRILNNDESFEVLLDHADAKLYQAKNAGRNQVCV